MSSFLEELGPRQRQSFVGEMLVLVRVELRQIVSHILHTMIPFRTNGYFESYFELIYALHGRHWRTRLRLIWLFNMITLLAMGYLALLYFRPVESLFWLNVIYDLLSILNLSYKVKLCSLPIFPMMNYFYYLFYISPVLCINALVRQIIILHRESVFTCKFYHGKPTSVYIRDIVFRILHASKLFAFAIGMIVIAQFILTTLLIADLAMSFYLILNITFIVKNYHFFLFTTFGIFCLILNLMILLMTDLVSILITHILLLAAVMAACLGTYFVIELEQVYNLLKSKYLITLFPSRQLSHFMMANNRVLQWGFKANLLYGHLLFAYLLVNVPLNAYLLMSIIHGKLSNTNTVIVMPFVTQQLVAFFFIHWVAASFSKRIHRCSKTLIHINVCHFYHCKNRITRLKLSHCIARFHTKNQYGMTYGNFGLISLTSMTRYLMIYFKVLMITYKMLIKETEST